MNTEIDMALLRGLLYSCTGDIDISEANLRQAQNKAKALNLLIDGAVSEIRNFHTYSIFDIYGDLIGCAAKGNVDDRKPLERGCERLLLYGEKSGVDLSSQVEHVSGMYLDSFG